MCVYDFSVWRCVCFWLLQSAADRTRARTTRREVSVCSVKEEVSSDNWRSQEFRVLVRCREGVGQTLRGQAEKHGSSVVCNDQKERWVCQSVECRKTSDFIHWAECRSKSSVSIAKKQPERKTLDDEFCGGVRGRLRGGIHVRSSRNRYRNRVRHQDRGRGRGRGQVRKGTSTRCSSYRWLYRGCSSVSVGHWLNGLLVGCLNRLSFLVSDAAGRKRVTIKSETEKSTVSKDDKQTTVDSKKVDVTSKSTTTETVKKTVDNVKTVLDTIGKNTGILTTSVKIGKGKSTRSKRSRTCECESGGVCVS